LIKNGANINQKDLRNRTVLHHAVNNSKA